ncbi:MAG: type I pullulanase [Paludibacteraceae bacterium]|nr:type I pullulanase [Paludibacteraceae bacterium]
MKKQIACMVLLATLVSCSTEKPQYASVDEYPSPKGSLNEMTYSPKQTQFQVWSPNAEAVYLNLYADAVSAEALSRTPMKRQKDGTWTVSLDGDHQGQFYTFSVTDNSTQWQLQETPGIFAKAVGINGRRGAIIDLRATDPEGWAEDRRPAFAGAQDAIIYEMHHRDMTIHPSAGVAHPGKFLAYTEEGTTSPEGLATGIDHLKELGITHVQILPSYDFGSIDENGASDEATVLESGAAAGGSYNWGYDPLNYNTPEGSYSTDPTDPACRIREMKQMIQALHKAGIRVIMDVVYNHTYDVAASNFTNTCPGYFYRTTPEGNLGNASGCGNETASDRPVMRQFILESIRYWVEEYHVDGFRFDLMGIHDVETMNAVRKYLDEKGENLLLYGEGWTAGSTQIPAEQCAVKVNVPSMPGIGAFCDDMRDALRGPFSDDHQGAFLAGLPGNEESIRFGIAGCIDHPEIEVTKVNYSKAAWCAEPTQCLAYVSCHDDMMLTDRLMASVDLKPGELERLDKLAQSAVLTSQGMAFIWCGEEIARNKKGVHNSFCSPDSINAIDWSLKAKNIDLFNYYKGMIALRKAHPAFHMGSADLVREHLHFLDTPDCVVAYRITDAPNDEWKDVIVVLNALREEYRFTLPAGSWTIAVGDGRIAKEPFTITGDGSAQIDVPAQSALIVHQ